MTKKPSTIFNNLSQDQVTDILIQNDLKETHIYKKNNQWKIQKDGIEYDADLDKVNAIINAYTALQKGEIVSNNKDKRDSFGIGKQKITLNTKTNSYVIFVGKNATVDTVYIAIDDNGEVFATSGFSDFFTSDDYRDLNPHLVADENNVTQVTIQYPDHTVIIDKQGTDWQSNQQKLTKEKVDFFLNDIKTLKASDMNSLSDVNIQLYPLSFSLMMVENKKTTTANMYQKDKDTYYVKSLSSNFVYQIPNVYVSSLQKEEKDFIN